MLAVPISSMVQIKFQVKLQLKEKTKFHSVVTCFQLSNRVFLLSVVKEFRVLKMTKN